MYQSLIWAAEFRHYAGGLAAALDAEDMEGVADALVDSVGRNVELGGDLFGIQMLIDKPKAVELPRA